MQKRKWLIVDPSALLGVFLNEDERPVLEQKTVGCFLAAPGCIRWEVGNALYSAFKRNRITLEEACSVFSEFESLSIQIMDVDMHASLEISAEKRVPAYDAYYLQCASSSGYPLLSLDQRMLDIARDMDLAIA